MQFLMRAVDRADETECDRAYEADVHDDERLRDLTHKPICCGRKHAKPVHKWKSNRAGDDESQGDRSKRKKCGADEFPLCSHIASGSGIRKWVLQRDANAHAAKLQPTDD